MPRTDLRPYIWMLCGSFSFTLMAVLAHSLLRGEGECDWQTVAVFRAGLVTVFGAVLVRATGGQLVFWPWRLWVRSLAGSCSMVCTFYAFSQLPVADVVTLTNTFPLWVAVLSWPLYGHLPGSRMLVAILVGVAGVALVEQPHFVAGNLGVLAALAAATFTAVAMLGLHSLGDLDPRAIVVHFSAVASVFCLGAFLVGTRTHDPIRILEWRVMWKLLAMGATALVGQLFLTLAFATGAPAKVSVVGLTQIVFALVFDVLLFNHPITAATLMGTALVIAPTAWLLTRPRPTQSHGSGIGDDPVRDHEIGSPADSTITPSLPR
jgi:drug/metabolite transporter (DMT)-like permease